MIIFKIVKNIVPIAIAAEQITPNFIKIRQLFYYAHRLYGQYLKGQS